jgi:Na+-transporting NADH:ubiquinone oxidoreductase subunit NqrC
MLNPLITDLTQYTAQQVEDRLFDLQRKYFLTQNSYLQEQIQTAIEIYQEELSTRRIIEAHRQFNQSKLK